MKLLPIEEKAIAEADCPFCMQRKSKKCKTLAGRLSPRPHVHRVDRVRD